MDKARTSIDKIDFYAVDVSRALPEWREAIEVSGVSLELAFLTGHLATLVCALWNLAKRGHSISAGHPQEVLVLLASACCVMRVVLLADPFGWLGVLPPTLRTVLEALPQLLLSCAVGFIVAVWFRLSAAVVRMERLQSKWALGRLRAPLLVSSAVLLCASVVLTAVAGRAVDLPDAVALPLLGMVRLLYGGYTLGVFALACVCVRRLLRALSTEVAVAVPPPAGGGGGGTARPLAAWCARTQVVPESTQITYKRGSGTYDRTPVALYVRGHLQPASVEILQELARRGSDESVEARQFVAQPLWAQVTHLAQTGAGGRHEQGTSLASLRSRLVAASATSCVVMCFWGCVFVYSAALRWLSPSEWLLYVGAEHSVELWACWFVLVSVWPRSRRRTGSFEGGKVGDGKEHSDKLFGDGDWAPLRGRGGNGGRAGDRFDHALKEVWQDETLLAYMAVAVGLRGPNAAQASAGGDAHPPRVPPHPFAAALAHAADGLDTILQGWRILTSAALGRRRSQARSSSGDSSGSTASVPSVPVTEDTAGRRQGGTTPLTLAPLPAPQPHDVTSPLGGGSTAGQSHPPFSTDGGRGAPTASVPVPGMTLPPGTVLEFSLDAVLSSPALRALLVDAQARELQACGEDHAALVSATAQAIAQSARDAINQMRSVQDSIVGTQAQSGQGAGQSEVSVGNPLRALGAQNNAPAEPWRDAAHAAGDRGGRWAWRDDRAVRDEAPLPPAPPRCGQEGEADGGEQLPASLVQWLVHEWPGDAAGGGGGQGRGAGRQDAPLRPRTVGWRGGAGGARPSRGDVPPPSPEEGGALVDLLVWAHSQERDRARLTAELSASSHARPGVVGPRRGSLDSAAHGPRASPSPSSSPSSSATVVYGAPAPAAVAQMRARHRSRHMTDTSAAPGDGAVVREPALPRSEGRDPRASSPAPVCTNPLAVLAAGMAAKEQERRRERRRKEAGARMGGSTTHSTREDGGKTRGAGVPPPGVHQPDDEGEEEEWKESPAGKAALRHERVLQMLANLRARGRQLPPSQELELQRALDAARDAVRGGTGT